MLIAMTLTEAFWAIHKGMPRQAPGSDSSTRSMLNLAGGASKFQRVLDIGCGSGRSAIVLAETGLSVTVIDLSDSLLEEARTSAVSKNLSINFKRMDMRSLPVDLEPFDLIWAEGSIYSIGFDVGLKAWRQFLKPDGIIVVTECVWTTSLPSNEAKLFWAQTYPGMLDVSRATTLANSAGYNVMHTYVMSDAAWWDEYYIPLQKRHDDLRNETDPNILKAIEIGRSELDLREKHHKEYGYIGFVMQRV